MASATQSIAPLPSPLVGVQGLRRVSPVRGDDNGFGTPITTRRVQSTKIPDWFRTIQKRGNSFSLNFEV